MDKQLKQNYSQYSQTNYNRMELNHLFTILILSKLFHLNFLKFEIVFSGLGHMYSEKPSSLNRAVLRIEFFS